MRELLFFNLELEMKKILSTNKEMNSQQIFHGNDHDDTYTVETRQDVTETLKQTAELRNQTTKHTRYNEGQTRVAHVPDIVIQDLMRKGIWGDQKKMKQILNSPDYKFLRTREGKV